MPNHPIIVYEKPTCSKCRDVMKTLLERQENFEAINYYETPLKKAELKKLLKMLGMKPAEILRTKEPIYKKLGIAKKKLTDDQLIGLMIKYPDLMQRPIVVKGNKAVLARPTEKLNELL